MTVKAVRGIQAVLAETGFSSIYTDIYGDLCLEKRGHRISLGVEEITTNDTNGEFGE